MISGYFQKYCNELNNTLEKISEKNLDMLANVFWDAYEQDKRIYIIGNGGSASTAAHYVCDFGKGTVVPGEKRMRIMSLTDNASHMTAISNDISYNEVFKEQLENLLEKRDVVICISASGNSPNLVQAIEYANSIGATTVGILGFSGGKLKDLTNVNIVIDNFNYGQVEDIHLILGHIFSQFFKARIMERKAKIS